MASDPPQADHSPFLMPLTFQGGYVILLSLIFISDLETIELPGGMI